MTNETPFIRHGMLEIDCDRGVIYFHDEHGGHTLLRICKLKIPNRWTPIDNMIDITMGREEASYGDKRW